MRGTVAQLCFVAVFAASVEFSRDKNLVPMQEKNVSPKGCLFAVVA